MSPALGCVVLLTVFFFGVYLVAVLARLMRVVAGVAVEKHLQPSPVEKAMVLATDALALAPMLCVLMISARLRAMELGMPAGDPPGWVQRCMYALTAAFFGRFLLDVLSGGVLAGQGPRYWLLRGVYGAASLVLYGGCAAIASGIVSLRAGSDGQRPPLSTMMQCMTVLAVAYIAECLAMECLMAVGSVRADAHRRRAEAADDEGTSWSGEGGGAAADLGGAGDVYGRVKSLAEEDSVLLQFPLMLCVLLVGMSLRAVQLRLQPEWWARVAMYATTTAIVSWTVLGMLTLSGWSVPGDAPASPGAVAGVLRTRGSVGACLSAGWVLLLATVYLGTTLIVASVFAMEARPMSAVWPEAQAAASRRDAAASHAAASPPAISTAMRCVMLLTVLYFGVHLCLAVGRAARGAAGRWARSVLEGARRALAFAPMLCVMMIAVRMRAVQLGVRDPPPWAQTAMLTAAVAVAVQVACSLCPTATKDPGGGGLLADTVLGKLLCIAVLLSRHAAAAASHAATAALVAALVYMDPGP